MAFNKQKALEAARKYRDKGQKDRAIKEYLKVVREDPKDVRVWLKIGDLYAQKGAKQDATETYLKVAKFYGDQGFYLKAVAVYKQILKLDPRMVEVNLKLAELYRQLGLISDAMQHFETVAGFFHREGKTREALATIRQLVELDPENVATRIKLAELYSKEEMPKEAVVEFEQACEYLKRHGREDDYVKVAERLLWHSPERTELARELASLYLQRRDPRRALQKLQACFKADARDVETLALLAQAFQALDQKGKTVSVLKELARVLSENGQRSQAEEVHRKILAYVPGDPDSMAFLGMEKQAENPPPRARNERLASIADGADIRAPSASSTGALPIVDEREREESLAADLSLDERSHLADGSSASAEFHADEIVKILTETDVYVKYGLHQKAIHHLHRVFELDSDNVEARERLKDIYTSQGRADEAIAELITLAQATVTSDPDRAETYLREILELDPNQATAVDLARRFRLDITKAMSPAPVEIVDEFSESVEFDLGAAGPNEASQLDDVLDFGELDFEDSALVGRAKSYDQAAGGFQDAPETLDPGAFDDLALEVEPATMRAPSEVVRQLTDSPAMTPAPDPTLEVSLDQVEEEVGLASSDDLDFDRPDSAPSNYSAPASYGDASLGHQLDAALEADDPLVLGERPTSPDGAAARESPEPAFASELSTDEIEEIHDLDEFDGELLEDASVSGPAVIPDELPTPPSLQPAASISTAGPVSGPGEPTHQVELPPESIDAGALDDDLDEADFYISQGLLEEARDILDRISVSHSGNPLVLAKLHELDEAEAAQVGSQPQVVDAMDDFADALPDESDKPSVIVGNAVDDADAATHFDLGQAYKEMGLLDEAVKEFQKVLSIGAREVQCHLMVGLCYRDQGKLSEAITQFKAGLYVPNINEAEKFGLYFEIGMTYESLSDPQEALYYYEMLLKKDPDYRDVGARVLRIKGAGTDPDKRSVSDDTEAALNGLE